MPEPINDITNAVNDGQENLKPADSMVNAGAKSTDDVELTIVTMLFDAADTAALVGVLSKYVVLARMEPGCRNIDLCASATSPRRLVVIEKWESPAAQRLHFDGSVMVEMAEACTGLLTAAPEIDLLDPISAHDLR